MERKLLTCFTLVAGVVLVVGCVTTVPTMATPTSSPNLDPVPDSAIQRPQTPIISDALRRGCRDDGKQGDFQNSGLPQGEAAVDFTLRNTEGNPFTLSELLNEKPVMMVFGSFT